MELLAFRLSQSHGDFQHFLAAMELHVHFLARLVPADFARKVFKTADLLAGELDYHVARSHARLGSGSVGRDVAEPGFIYLRIGLDAEDRARPGSSSSRSSPLSRRSQ